jgi:hypothetical protein
MLWESCSSSYTEHNKIGFAIFGFFCDFIRILQVAAKSTQRGKKRFCKLNPRKIGSLTTIPLVCTKHPGQSLGLAMWSLDQGGGAAGQNPASTAAGLAGGDLGWGLGVVGHRFRFLLAAETGPAAGHGGSRRRRPLEAVAPANCYSA